MSDGLPASLPFCSLHSSDKNITQRLLLPLKNHSLLLLEAKKRKCTTMNESQIYEVSLNVRVAWQAHSISNAGNNGSNRLLPRRQLLSCGTETDACSGNIAKHFHAVLLAEYLEAAGGPLCPACKVRDGRRAA